MGSIPEINRTFFGVVCIHSRNSNRTEDVVPFIKCFIVVSNVSLKGWDKSLNCLCNRYKIQ